MEYDDKKGDSKKLSEGNYAGDKWGGKYLRAPDIYWKIMDRLQPQTTKKLRQSTVVKRGVTSGVNDFFHFDAAKARHWGVESRFLRPLIKTPRDYYGIKIPGSEVLLFWCQDERESLKGTKALAYIEWGEEQGFHKTPSCASRRNWYSLKGPEKPALLWPSAFFERHIVYECPKNYVADKVFYTISGSLPPGLNAYLNSSIVSLFVEVEGYQLNHGGIFVTTDWLANLPVVEVSESSVLRSYEKLTSRDILLCGDELEEKSRKELDLAVLKQIGLGEAEMCEMHEAIKAYVAGRIHKARRGATQRGRQETARSSFDEDVYAYRMIQQIISASSGRCPVKRTVFAYALLADEKLLRRFDPDNADKWLAAFDQPVDLRAFRPALERLIRDDFVRWKGAGLSSVFPVHGKC